jgi:hypothetical protein
LQYELRRAFVDAADVAAATRMTPLEQWVTLRFQTRWELKSIDRIRDTIGRRFE